MGRLVPPIVPPRPLLERASLVLRRRYLADELELDEFKQLVAIALEHGDPEASPRPGGIRGPNTVQGEIAELATPDLCFIPDRR